MTTMTDHQMISCFKGLAPVSMPAEWLAGFDIKTSFGIEGRQARIRFPNGKAFGISVSHHGAHVHRAIVPLSPKQIQETNWGPFGPPWESYQTSKLFGHGLVTKLDEIAPYEPMTPKAGNAL